MQDNVEEVLELLYKLLGELQSPLLKKYILPAAKRIGADLFQIAASEIEEVASGRKKLKTFAKDLGQKQFGNNWEVEKRNLSVELVEPDPFLGKIDQKTVALAKIFLNIM